MAAPDGQLCRPEHNCSLGLRSPLASKYFETEVCFTFVLMQLARAKRSAKKTPQMAYFLENQILVWAPCFCQAIECLKAFSSHLGLHVNIDKSAIFLTPQGERCHHSSTVVESNKILVLTH